MLLNSIGLILQVGPALIVVAALSLLFARSPRASIALVLFTTVLTESREWPFALSTEISTFNVSVFDVFTLLLSGVALFRFGWKRVERPGRGAMLTIATLTALGLVTWVLVEGLQVSVNFWRQWMFPIGACWYATSWPVLRSRAGLQPVVWAALLGSLTQSLGIALRGFGSNSDRVLVNGEFVGARPITASVALLILFGAVLLLIDAPPVTLRRLAATGWLWASVLIAQHRSVWVAAIVAGALVGLALVKGSRQRLVTATLVGVGLVGVGTLAGGLVRRQQQLAAASSDTETLDWRFENWAEKMSVPREPVEWLIGSALGPTPVTDRFESTLQFQVSAHSMLIDVISSLGFVGALAVGVIVVVAIRVPYRIGSSLGILIGALLSYGFFYAWPLWSWLVVGILIRTAGVDQDSGGPQTVSELKPSAVSVSEGSVMPTASVRTGQDSGAVC